jgi:predicted component of type VI protein secretion system
MVKAYCGLLYEFDIKLAITQSCLPRTVLSASKQSQLGWNSTMPLRKSREIKRIVKISVNQCQRVA